MPMFSQESFSKLTTCHEDLQVLFYEVIKHIDCEIIQGYRNKDDHDSVDCINVKHKHSPATAVDVTPKLHEGVNLKSFYLFAGFVLGIAQKLKDDGKMSHSVRYGCEWDGDLNNINVNLRYLSHFELMTD